MQDSSAHRPLELKYSNIIDCDMNNVWPNPVVSELYRSALKRKTKSFV